MYLYLDERTDRGKLICMPLPPPPATVGRKGIKKYRNPVKKKISVFDNFQAGCSRNHETNYVIRLCIDSYCDFIINSDVLQNKSFDDFQVIVRFQTNQ